MVKRQSSICGDPCRTSRNAARGCHGVRSAHDASTHRVAGTQRHLKVRLPAVASRNPLLCHDLLDSANGSPESGPTVAKPNGTRRSDAGSEPSQIAAVQAGVGHGYLRSRWRWRGWRSRRRRSGGRCRDFCGRWSCFLGRADSRSWRCVRSESELLRQSASKHAVTG